jgi:hypothetical protein
VLGAAAFFNYRMWGRPDGDDNTPIGAIRVGGEGGRTQYFDLTSLTGLTRGARMTGLLALLEGQRAGARSGAIADKAVEQFVDSLLHPAMGPPVSFLHTAVTGRNSVGMQVAERAHGDESQAWENLKAALLHANPVAGTFSSPDRPGQERSLGQRAMELLGPFGVRERSSPPGQERRRR